MSNDLDFTNGKLTKSVTMAKEKLDDLFALYVQCADFTESFSRKVGLYLLINYHRP